MRRGLTYELPAIVLVVSMRLTGVEAEGLKVGKRRCKNPEWCSLSLSAYHHVTPPWTDWWGSSQPAPSMPAATELFWSSNPQRLQELTLRPNLSLQLFL
jgi:hypothetical protein